MSFYSFGFEGVVDTLDYHYFGSLTGTFYRYG